LIRPYQPGEGERMPDLNESLAGKVIMVTGSTGGIGLATAKGLARKGASVLIVGRRPQRCQAAVDEVRRASGNSDIDFLVADLSSQKEVRRLAQEFKERRDRLDVLINNAGGIFFRRELSADGIELTFALNHLACFLLTNLLLDTLKSAPEARIVNVSSVAHFLGRIDFSDFQSYGWKGYCGAKLALLLFTYELARRLAGTGVTVNALHPGQVASSFGMNNPGLFPLFRPLIDLFRISNEEGARTSIYLTSSPKVRGVTGRYFVRCKEHRSSRQSYDLESAARMWQISAEMTGLEK
jgi:NAD(P)-dependent dehydrogenase (short-subunit alcohol dehydrogenase family)